MDTIERSIVDTTATAYLFTKKNAEPSKADLNKALKAAGFSPKVSSLTKVERDKPGARVRVEVEGLG